MKRTMDKPVDTSKLEELQGLCRKGLGFKIVLINRINYLKSVRLRYTIYGRTITCISMQNQGRDLECITN